MPYSPPILPRLLPLALLLAAACGGGGEGDDDGAPDAGISPLCQEATMHEDFAWIQQKVFMRSCAFSSCHSGATPKAGLSLDGSNTFASLVGKPAQEAAAGGMMLVAPGHPEQSYLLVALGAAGVAGTPPSEGIMPLTNPRLCDQKIDAIKRWIAAGAKEGDE